MCGTETDGSELGRRVEVDRSRAATGLKPLDDRALWPCVAMAVLREMLEGCGHPLHLARFPLQNLYVLQGDPLHVRAGPAAVPPQGDEFRDLLDGEAEVAGPPDE